MRERDEEGGKNVEVPLRGLAGGGAESLVITKEHQEWAGAAADRLRKEIERKPDGYGKFYEKQAQGLAKRMSKSARTKYSAQQARAAIEYAFWQRNGERRPAAYAKNVERRGQGQDRGKTGMRDRVEKRIAAARRRDKERGKDRDERER